MCSVEEPERAWSVASFDGTVERVIPNDESVAVSAGFMDGMNTVRCCSGLMFSRSRGGAAEVGDRKAAVGELSSNELKW